MTTYHIKLRWSGDTRESVQEFTLDGVRCRWRAMYNATAGRWYLDVSDIEDVLIVGSIALVPGVDLLLPYKHLAIPQGRLYVEDPINDAPPDLQSLDASALLKYESVS